jgi:hypothetical protein
MGFDKLPRYFAVNDLPVKFVETPDGGMDVLAWDWKANDFVRHLEYLDAVMKPASDVQELTESEFNALADTTRARSARR